MFTKRFSRRRLPLATDDCQLSDGGSGDHYSFGEEEVTEITFSFDPFQTSWERAEDFEVPTRWNDHAADEEEIHFIDHGDFTVRDQPTREEAANFKSSLTNSQEGTPEWGENQGDERLVAHQGFAMRAHVPRLDRRSWSTRNFSNDEEVATQQDQSFDSMSSRGKGLMTRCSVAMWFLLLASVFVAALVGIVGFNEDATNGDSMTDLAPTPAQVDSAAKFNNVAIAPVAGEPTTATTTSPSSAPSVSAAPTMPPTSFSFVDVPISHDGLTISLPSYTLAALDNPLSPQYKAFQWIKGNYSLPVLAVLDEWRKQQLFAMAAIYYSFHGDHWHGDNRQDWLKATVSECDWIPTPIEAEKGPQIDCEQGHVSLLRLTFISSTRGLKHSTLPPEVELLSSLQSLTVEESYLEGRLEKVLPPNIARLSETLQKLDLSFNRLKGSLPSYLWELTALTELSLGSQNELSGSIPTEIAALTALRILQLDNNDSLNGAIPSELSLLANLTKFDCGRTEIQGSIPTELGMMKQLSSLGIYWSLVSGHIPSELGLLPLTRLYAHFNSLQGEIPSELGLLTSLTWLSVGGNLLSGSIPSELGLLSNSLVGLQMEMNSLSGMVPDEIESLSLLVTFDVGRNVLSSEIDSDVVCKRAQELYQLQVDAYCEEPPCWNGCGCLEC